MVMIRYITHTTTNFFMPPIKQKVELIFIIFMRERLQFFSMTCHRTDVSDNANRQVSTASTAAAFPAMNHAEKGYSFHVGKATVFSMTCNQTGAVC